MFNIWISNKQGNETYYETSSGYWSKTTYDKKSNRIYFENSKGFWPIKSTYDKNDNEIYYKNSKGKKIKY